MFPIFLLLVYMLPEAYSFFQTISICDSYIVHILQDGENAVLCIFLKVEGFLAISSFLLVSFSFYIIKSCICSIGDSIVIPNKVFGSF